MPVIPKGWAAARGSWARRPPVAVKPYVLKLWISVVSELPTSVLQVAAKPGDDA